MEGGISSKRQVEARRDGQSSRKRQNVTMGMETLDCPICYLPLRPPIYQCTVGHFVCSSCHPKLLAKKCHLCSVETSFKRCIGMERLMDSLTVPCSNAMYGCAKKMTYYQKEEHEKACPYVPCFCPESTCGFGGPTAALLDHLISQHKWPSTTITYSNQVDFRVHPGLHVLCTEDGHIFLLNMALEPFGHAISVICIQPVTSSGVKYKFECEMDHHCSVTRYFQSSTYKIRSSSLSDGLPTGYNFILPKGEISDDREGILLTVTIRDSEPMVRKPICLKPKHGV
ncbi:E3 ubiquitin-protein ligase SINA-like 7 [Brachypodium distachyon]|uniref:RING-type E3 ubiquitin transferase n=1 Tax=Brachypodium distachyon TaxID=15368 RepID=I1HBJ9_BRADI|nr:E3 ubiquitin-protein ligase SINA-like 7 [Brachypodium distachyon]XP_010230395.1 E3 ubiquitin-protein ligase SINA-like 7 [Brachypodium distachyon]KQK02488.1 hypothetical protein BRADI_2g01770v3 [Brachypodium distachyon]|eukprot:XP_003565279.1 E3 ubiquitin-protein ligase SINA-like 7 [Brachypodium distachyon]